MIAALAGGIGASKLLLGISALLPADQLTIIGNTGDDLELVGLRICPDLDTITYTLAGKANPATGWGIAGDSFDCLTRLGELGGPAWFQLGDRDLATHLWRTSLLRQGISLSEVTRRISQAMGVGSLLLPMTDSFVPTHLDTDQGRLHLQEYLVREGCRPTITAIEYRDADQADPAPGVAEALLQAEAIVLCPSNPFISIAPILAISGIRELLRRTSGRVLAVTPIVQGGAVKGPTAKMLTDLGYPVSPTSVAEMYRDFLDIFVLDQRDEHLGPEIEKLGVRVKACDTLMPTLESKTRLASELFDLL